MWAFLLISLFFFSFQVGGRERVAWCDYFIEEGLKIWRIMMLGQPCKQNTTILWYKSHQFPSYRISTKIQPLLQQETYPWRWAHKSAFVRKAIQNIHPFLHLTAPTDKFYYHSSLKTDQSINPIHDHSFLYLLLNLISPLLAVFQKTGHWTAEWVTIWNRKKVRTSKVMQPLHSNYNQVSGVPNQNTMTLTRDKETYLACQFRNLLIISLDS